MQSDSFDTPPDETLMGTVVSEDYTGGLTKNGFRFKIVRTSEKNI